MVDEMESIFLKYVMERRNIKRFAFDTIKDGRTITGVTAHNLGLVDALGSKQKALEWLEKNHQIGQDTPVISIELEREGHWLEEMLTQTKMWPTWLGFSGNMQRKLRYNGC